ncbi:hypothetical protein Ssi03_22230 [Sphaerisporangium siamense]|uniref:Uncharacterized protein n=1 Tax=Sphaerisporangium siamense TaxID=795645 RepID=A0A7W7GAW7_9ACTN|nr:hypothetical protein [Sphaerisporangium siamense]MBB4701859.1 hypothetical protein [Sphaerisporangium siamense]GII84233.1 hypothetical protein Ssi03_22230 [Sphaerisporangium siamense]
MEAPGERSGTLILRVWVEEGRRDGFRARVICTVGPGEARSWAVSEPADVHAVVQAWLDGLLEPGG